jgi:hypothetical protein
MLRMPAVSALNPNCCPMLAAALCMPACMPVSCLLHPLALCLTLTPARINSVLRCACTYVYYALGLHVCCTPQCAAVRLHAGGPYVPHGHGEAGGAVLQVCGLLLGFMG